MIKALAFDLYGTLVDVTSISKAFPYINVGVELKSFIEIWRLNQLQYAWLLTILNRYESFNDLSIRALKLTAKIHGIHLTDLQIRKLSEAGMKLDAFPDSARGLKELIKLRERNKNLVYFILSNGETARANKILLNAKLKEYFDHILSVEKIQKYKPSLEAYMMASEVLKIPISEIVMVSSNSWDIAGAQRAGMLTCFIDRSNVMKITCDEMYVDPTYTFSSIGDMKQIKELKP